MSITSRVSGLILASAVVFAIGAPARALEPHVFVVSEEGGSGESAAMAIDAPWTVAAGLETVGRMPLVRHFFGRHYVVNRGDETIQVIDPDTFDTLVTLQVGSAPRDIAVVGARQAYVTRFDSAELIELDPTSGLVTGTIDLGFLADADGIPEMDTMALAGYHLFVQLQRLDRRGEGLAPGSPSALAVIDVRTGQVVDVDPVTPGVQAIRLAGKRPAYKMVVETDRRRLYVSVPAGFFDGIDGAIEEIDLDTFESLGFVTTENTLQTRDLSGFVMVSPDKGFVITHTEIVESSHVTGFSRATDVDRATGRLSLSYSPACQAADHHVVFGPLAEVSSHGYVGQDCRIGNLGSYDGFDPGSGSVFFLVVGSDGVATEGPYGTATGSIERPQDNSDGECGFDRDLSLRCD